MSQEGDRAKEAWQKALKENKQVQEFMRRIEAGLPGYKTVEEMASQTGQIAGRILSKSVVDNAVDGMMSETDAAQILQPTMTANYKYVADAAEKAQLNINKEAGNGLGAVRPQMNQDRINGLVKEIAASEDVAALAPRLTSQIENASMSVVDDFVRENADFQYEVGKSPVIIREGGSTCCKWCADLTGVYEYSRVRNTGNDVFRRHDNCRCTIEFDPGHGGARQNVHTKKMVSREEVERRAAMQDEIMSPEERQTAFRARQEGDTWQPADARDDFYDFKELDISDDERKTLEELRRLADEDDYEHGKTYYHADNEWSEPVDNKNHSGVNVPMDRNQQMSLYHSHTDDSLPSPQDVTALIDPRINRIGVITKNRDVWVIDIGAGIKPNEEELREAIRNIAEPEAQRAVMENPNFANWTFEERYYMLGREKALRTARYFEWDFMGGSIDG